MGTKTFRTPVTIHDGRQYCAPGTEVTLEEGEANRILAAHGGEFGENGKANDPGNTNLLNAMDHASIDALNIHAGINGGQGLHAPEGAAARMAGQRPGVRTLTPGATGATSQVKQAEPLPSDHELEAMKKDELVDFAESRNVDVAASDSKAEIIAKLKAAK